MKDCRGKPTNQTNNHQQTKGKKSLIFKCTTNKVAFNLARFYFMPRSIGYRKNGTFKGKLICIK